MYWLFANAFTPITSNPPLTPLLIPAFKLDNFARLLVNNKFYLNWMLNSLIVAFAITAFHVFFDTLAGYAFAKKRFPGRNLFFVLILTTLMIPIHVTFIPLYIINRSLGLIDSLWALILPGTAWVFGIFLMRQYIQTLPSELIDAARIDGAGEFGVFRHMIFPLSMPAMAALAIFTFVREWNDFLWPVIALNKPQNYTLTVGVANLARRIHDGLGHHLFGRGARRATNGDLFPPVPEILSRRRPHGRAAKDKKKRKGTDAQSRPSLFRVYLLR